MKFYKQSSLYNQQYNKCMPHLTYSSIDMFNLGTTEEENHPNRVVMNMIFKYERYINMFNLRTTLEESYPSKLAMNITFKYETFPRKWPLYCLGSHNMRGGP